MLGEMECKGGSVEIEGSIAFVPQIPWILNATVRENILFGTPFDAQRYRKAVELSCMGRDFDQLPSADQTLIGEKGINLSGVKQSLHSWQDFFHVLLSLMMID